MEKQYLPSSFRWLSSQGNHHKQKRLQTFMRMCLLIGMGVCLFGPRLSSAQLVNKTAKLKDGHHFVLLVDDSGDMKQWHKEEIVKSLPGQLFGGIPSRDPDDPLSPSLPKFEPGRDQISVLFFTIRGKQESATADPDKMFQLEYTGSLRDPNDFATKLNEWLGRSGRSSGNYSPIAISQLLALSYLQNHLPDKELYRNTYFIVATNGRYNVSSPGHELTYLKGERVQDIEKASQAAYKASTLFYFNIPPAWIISRPAQVYYLISELKPQPLPESALQYQSDTSLDVEAESPSKLRVKLKNDRAGDLQILPIPLTMPYRFEPMTVQMKFENYQGKPWRIGNTTLPENASLSLSDCNPPTCLENNNVLDVSLFNAAVEGLSLSAQDADPDAGRITLRVGFHYKTDIYDLLYVETLPQKINVRQIEYLSLPGILFLPDGKLNKTDVLSEWTKDSDGLTTQEETKNRIDAARSWRWLAFALLLLLLFAALFLTIYQRRFVPRLKWQPVAEVVVDFNRPAASRLLLGTLKVINEGKVPWFGKIFRNKEQPTRHASFNLSYNFFKEQGFKVKDENPIGFVNNAQDASDLELLNNNIEEVVSNDKQIYLFLAANSLTDYGRRGVAATPSGKDFRVPLSVEMAWRPYEETSEEASLIERVIARLKGNTDGSLTHEIECQFTIKPEAESRPVLMFEPSKEVHYYKQGEKLKIGTLKFTSQAGHDFAQPFVWGNYTVKAYRDNFPLSGEPIVLEPAQVKVMPGKTAHVPLYLRCDGDLVPNPDPVSHLYTFRVIGVFDSKSEPGPHKVILHRDSARGEIELTITYPEPLREIFWAEDGSTNQRILLEDGTGTQASGVQAATMKLDEMEVKFDSDSMPTTLLGLKIGNSAKSGRGQVIVDVATRFVVEEGAALGIHIPEDQRLDDLIAAFAYDQEDSNIRVHEGEAPEIREIRIDTRLITKIEGARTESCQCLAEINLKIHVETDQGEESDRELKLVIPLILEKLPGLNWLCIDYGTSAIAAALGTGGGIERIPLQEIKMRGGMSLNELDIGNAEVNSRYLLPSWVICDADLRNKFEVEAGPGFPLYYPKEKGKTLSLRPGEPDFVGLPALRGQFRQDEKKNRIIYSLKSWLGKSSSSIPLRTEVSYQEDGKLVKKDRVPLELVVESGLAALAEAYLLIDPDYRADRIVLSHPNTFTQRHKDVLREIAYKAFGKRFDIPLRERIRLISESDAVAYYYCWEQMRKTSRSGSERILVYDFGAGTLDLSIIRIEWESEPVCYPKGWRVEGRIGVPVAGNYFDELLARIVDRLLLDEPTIGSSEIKYNYRVVGRSFVEGEKTEHRDAIVGLWEWIREAKHLWGDTWRSADRLNIRIGTVGSKVGIVSGKVEGLNTEPPTDDHGLPIAGLWTKDGYIYMSLPASEVHNDTQVVAFIQFVTRTIIDELFHAAKIQPDDIDTVVVTGRGALWPGLRDHVWEQFPDATHPDLHEDGAMKEAVVQGAIARQELLVDEIDEEPVWQPKLGVLINDDHDLVLEDDWDNPIDLTRSSTFRIVQVNVKDPQPRQDRKSLRRHFYVDLVGQTFRRDGILGGTKQIYIKKEMLGDKLALYLENKQRNKRVSVFAPAYAAGAVTSPPWPVGDLLLKPEEKKVTGRQKDA